MGKVRFVCFYEGDDDPSKISTLIPVENVDYYTASSATNTLTCHLKSGTILKNTYPENQNACQQLNKLGKLLTKDNRWIGYSPEGCED